MPAKPTITERLDKHDRQIAAIRELIHEGMRLVIETRKDFRTIAAMQKETAANLRALTNNLRGGGNGHTNGKSKHQ
jgi:low affinity Fe/Cu permease